MKARAPTVPRALGAPALLCLASLSGPAAQEAARFPEHAYFGDLHLHTGYSLDAAWMTLATPDDAYRHARGEAIERPGGGTLRLGRPLDFLAVTDHAEYLGLYQELQREGGKLHDRPLAEALRSVEAPVRRRAYLDAVARIQAGRLDDPEVERSIWRSYCAAAARHDQPGTFTAFIGFEWSSMPGNWNLHRNVIFGGAKVPERPFSALDSERPEDLWTYLENARRAGSDVLAIAHNGNLSGGRMFALTDSDGKAIDAPYAVRRRANEIAHEIVQVKGQSETHPSIALDDEFAGFEAAAVQLGTMKELTEGELAARFSYVREAYKNGLVLQGTLGANPFRFGLVAGSDSHVGATLPEESAIPGGQGEGTPEARLGYRGGSGGLTGIWAQENTRASLFAALGRNETFGTSGVRLRPRIFGGWTFAPDLLEREGWLATAYAEGVPMGGDLGAAAGKAPTFAVAALKDPAGANLDRIQIVKCWAAGGQAFERIHDVALSGGRRVDPATGRAPPVGSTVDLAKATYADTIGAAELEALWTDPDFDPRAPACYYARVLEIPTPRWSTIDAAAHGGAPRSDVQATIQERAWTSPIWYTPPR